ncbi:AslB (DUF239) [Arabidopsis thaliana]|uniref:AslB (DUF239) n=2 Tax=Arabidopsis thaliana TaxID=3702 RepID=F4JYA1_ARATH|nr:AslB (DUF239) [Arabidopsis thaliana]AED93505.2 AslB (DUF239) [Arabidopsis thaliana]|eukprot:NP_001318652.1 AslB (DUF239) [Arabidopsis thaliana]
MRLFLIFAILCGFYNEAYGKGSLDIDMKLKSLNKPSLKTIKSEDGDIIDCIDIYKQHAFDHPALRNHKIQMKPSVDFGTKKTTIPNNGSSEQITSQIWSKSGNCPKGTIPEAVLMALGYNFIGAQSDINVWNPPRVQASDYSSAQIWLLGGLSDTFESIEAGWAVNPSVFGDSRTRLFTYWTKDGYSKTGCVNLLCAGFVQTTTKFALGAAIEPVSTTSQKQHFITVSMFLDTNSGNWWLTCANNVIGYWPGTLFAYLKHSATAVQCGGEVHSPNVGKKPHTRTSMGSGQWASYLWAQACYHSNIRIKDYSLQIKYPKYLSEYADEYECYSTKLHRKTYMSEPYFYFGGPGQNSRCP